MDPFTGPQRELLLRSLRHLGAEGDHRSIVRLVEAWSDVGRPPAEALVLEARAFLHLRLMDRAWVRLREAREQRGDDPDLLALTATMFVERGWPGRARKLVARALEERPHDPEIHRLLREACRPPRVPPANARAIERTGSPEERLELAERFMSTGSFLRARSLLERLRGEPGAWSPRVDDLLWALRGDFALPTADLLAFARTCLPVEMSPSVEPDDESLRERTATGAGLPVAEQAPPMPSLFRRQEDGPLLRAGGEVTRISRMAEVAELRERESGEEPDGDVGDPGAGESDTRVMLVIGGDRSGPVHVRHDGEDDPLHRTLDLKAWQASVGMGVPSDLDDVGEVDLETDGAYLEEEDESLIVMTRQEEDPSHHPEAAPSDAPIEVLEPPGAPSEPPPRSPSAAPPRSPPASRPPASPRSRRANTVALSVAGVVLGLLLVGGAWLWAGHRARWAPYREVVRTLAGGRLDVLLALEGRLAPLADRPPEAAALAVLDAVLWNDFTGDRARRERAAELLQAAAAGGAPGEPLAVASGWLRYGAGDAEGALEATAALGEDAAEAAHLRARVFLERGAVAQAAQAVLTAVDRSGGGARHLGLLARVCRAAGDDACLEQARAGLQASGAADLAALVALEVDEGSVPPAVLVERVEAYLGSGRDLPPRYASRALLLEARLHQASGRPDRALEALGAALARDPEGADVLEAFGAGLLAANRPADAQREFRACAELRPLDDACRVGAVAAALLQERTLTARRLLGSAGTERPVLEAWVALVEGDPGPGAALAGRKGDPLPAWVAGSARLAQGDPAGAAPLLEGAARGMEGGGPVLRALAPLAWARAARAGVRGAAGRAMATGGHRAEVLAELALGVEDAREAASLLDRAVRLGPEVARAWWIRASWYGERARGRNRARTALRRFLALDPNGPHAREASQRLENR